MDYLSQQTDQIIDGTYMTYTTNTDYRQYCDGVGLSWGSSQSRYKKGQHHGHGIYGWCLTLPR
jgi:hypothetical protein